jgi:hypothetical protein
MFYTFNKEEDGKWYVDLPSWEGDKEELEMVMGADTMLDIISQGDNTVRLYFSEEYFEPSNYTLTFKYEENDGGWYNLASDLFSFEVWLCHVTKFVFGYLPKTIYIN